MATVRAQVAQLNDDAVRVSWPNMANGDIGESYTGFSEYADRSVQVSGEMGVGGIVEIKGSNDGTNFDFLSDPQGSSMSVSTTRIRQIVEYVPEIRPAVVAGDSNTLITVTIVAKRVRRA